MIFVVTMTIRDQKKRVGAYRLYIEFDDGTDLEELKGYVQAIATELDEITGGWILDINASLHIPLPGGLKVSASTDIEERARVFFGTAPLGWHNEIPGFLESIFGGAKEIDLDAVLADMENDLVILLLTPMDRGFSGVRACNKNGDQLQNPVFAHEVFKKSGSFKRR